MYRCHDGVSHPPLADGTHLPYESGFPAVYPANSSYDLCACIYSAFNCNVWHFAPPSTFRPLFIQLCYKPHAHYKRSVCGSANSSMCRSKCCVKFCIISFCCILSYLLSLKLKRERLLQVLQWRYKRAWNLPLLKIQPHLQSTL